MRSPRRGKGPRRPTAGAQRPASPQSKTPPASGGPSAGPSSLPERIRRREWHGWALKDWISVVVGVISVVAALGTGAAAGIDYLRDNIASGQPSCGMSMGAEQPGLMVSGYVLVAGADSAESHPSVSRACNSRDADNGVTRRGPGRYDVRMEKLGVDGGTVEVTAVGRAARVCGTDGWGMAENGTDLTVRVICADEHGPRDSGFALRFLQAASGTGALAYLRYDAGAASPFVPQRNYSFNSFYSAISVEHEKRGEYEIFLQDIQESADRGAPGVVKVTSLGPVPRVCNPMVWGPWQNKRTGKRFLLAKVHCFDSAGTKVDSGFALTYAVKLASRPDLSVSGAQLWANDASARRYTPTMDYQYNSTGHTSMIQRKGPGSYAVELAGFSGDGGQVQVSGYGGPASCTVAQSPERLGDSTTVAVQCWRNGQPADSMFALLYQA